MIPFHVGSTDPAVDLDSTNSNCYSLLADTFHEVDCQCYAIWRSVVAAVADVNAASYCSLEKCSLTLLADLVLDDTVDGVGRVAKSVALSAVAVVAMTSSLAH